MVLFHLTPALRAALLAIAPSDPSDDSANLLRSIRREKGKSTAVLAGDDTVEDGEVREEVETIDHELLIKFIRASDGSTRLNELLRLTELFIPKPVLRQKSAKLLAILAEIQLAADEAAYKKMTSHPTSSTLFSDPSSPSAERTAAEAASWKLINQQLSSIINIFVSMLSIGVGVWWVGGGRSYAARLGLSLGGAVLIGAVEGFLYWRFFSSKSTTAAMERDLHKVKGKKVKVTKRREWEGGEVLKFD